MDDKFQENNSKFENPVNKFLKQSLSIKEYIEPQVLQDLQALTNNRFVNYVFVVLSVVAGASLTYMGKLTFNYPSILSGFLLFLVGAVIELFIIMCPPRADIKTFGICWSRIDVYAMMVLLTCPILLVRSIALEDWLAAFLYTGAMSVHYNVRQVISYYRLMSITTAVMKNSRNNMRLNLLILEIVDSALPEADERAHERLRNLHDLIKSFIDIKS